MRTSIILSNRSEIEVDQTFGIGSLVLHEDYDETADRTNPLTIDFANDSALERLISAASALLLVRRDNRMVRDREAWEAIENGAWR